MPEVTTPPAAPAPAAPAAPEPTKLEQAEAIVKQGIFWSMGGGAIPVPWLDIAGIAGAQTYMLSRLGDVYKIPYEQHRLKNLVATMMSSLGTGALATGAVMSLVKLIPIVGTASGVISLPIVAGGSTYALGKVFIQHFESGGTFLDFDPVKTKEAFAKLIEEGKAIATGEVKKK